MTPFYARRGQTLNVQVRCSAELGRHPYVVDIYRQTFSKPQAFSKNKSHMQNDPSCTSPRWVSLPLPLLRKVLFFFVPGERHGHHVFFVSHTWLLVPVHVFFGSVFSIPCDNTTLTVASQDLYQAISPMGRRHVVLFLPCTAPLTTPSHHLHHLRRCLQSKSLPCSPSPYIFVLILFFRFAHSYAWSRYRHFTSPYPFLFPLSPHLCLYWACSLHLTRKPDGFEAAPHLHHMGTQDGTQVRRRWSLDDQRCRAPRVSITVLSTTSTPLPPGLQS
ncbi:hypothetical protein V8E53_011146 [Lactarius tabidus]|jgi:hypothetical protein